MTLYASLVVTFTFYIRRAITRIVWHLIHLASYLLFAAAIAHGALSGTDSGAL